MEEERQKWNRFIELSVKEKLLFLEALLLQLWIGLLLKVIPFRWIPILFRNRLYGIRHEYWQRLWMVKRESRIPKPVSQQPVKLTLIRIKVANQRASRVSPWKNKCLVQSLAVRCMLNRLNVQSQLSFGVAKEEDGKVSAHAWIRAGGVELVEKGGEYRELYLF